jgi:16S rRNA (adenine1518-N6/adenine1519-N6)-dimethyltransferase
MNLQHTKALLRAYGLHPNKRLGQHFLVDPAAAERIVAAAQIKPDETVLEVGPGLGALTRLLLQQARHVIAVELDERLCALLKKELKDQPAFRLINGDFLDLDLHGLAQQAGEDGLKIVGNLPYHITGQSVRMILDHLHSLRGAVITVQREVANRIMANPGGKTFGVLSVAAQYLSRPKLLLHLRKQAFYPQPQIASTVVSLAPRLKAPIHVDDEAFFFTVVRALFAHRRKMARNALRTHPHIRLKDNDLGELFRRTQIDLGRRAETMSLEELGQLSNVLRKLRNA